MSYALQIGIHLGSSLSGLTLNGQLFNSVGADVGSEITTGFTEIGDGEYTLIASIPDGHRGGIKIYEEGIPGTILASGAINPTGSGAGAITFTYIVTNSLTLLPIEGVTVRVSTDISGSNVIAEGETNPAGEVIFYLDAGTYYFWSVKSGYVFINPDTEVVT